MKALNKAGFTIIETMLFLGITGLLAMGVLAGTGTALNTQRYRDSVSSLKSILQQQYSDVANVNNNLSNNWTCDSSGLSEVSVSGASTPLGRSDCVILGRFITTSNGSDLSIKDVIGYIGSESVSGLNDIDALKEYTKAKVSTLETEIYSIEWGSSVVPQKSNIGMNFSILILRSPASGTIRTFIDSENVINSDDINNLINSTALNKSITMCVDSNGLFTGYIMAVRINANATGATGVETLGEDNGC